MADYSGKMRKHEAVALDELVKQFIKDMKLDTGLNRQRVTEVWSEVSGAGRYTLDVSLEKGVLYCSISSSMVRNQLYFQREVLVQKLNEFLAADKLYDNGGKEEPAVKVLSLK